jgi:hypothetical protein
MVTPRSALVFIMLTSAAGVPMQHVVGSDTAVFMGTSCKDYTDLLLGDLERTELYQATGTGQTMLANRISYFFDLKGSSVTLDTGIESFGVCQFSFDNHQPVAQVWWPYIKLVMRFGRESQKVPLSEGQT